MLVKGAKYANFVVFVLIEIESIKVAISQLQEVIVQTLFRDADVLGSLLECDTLLCVHATPLTNFNHNFTDDSLFFAPGAQILPSLCPALDQGVRVFRLGPLAEL